jgi:hypothetical protein
VLQLLKVGKFPLHIDQLFLQSAAYWRTGLQATPSQIQETSNLAQFESQTLYAADKSKRLDVILAVLTKAPLCSGRPWQQIVALIEPNRVNAEANLPCNDANLHYLGSSLRNLHPGV